VGARAGHRSIGCDSLPLKRGMLVFAHSRKMPVQVRAGGRTRRRRGPAPLGSRSPQGGQYFGLHDGVAGHRSSGAAHAAQRRLLAQATKAAPEHELRPATSCVCVVRARRGAGSGGGGRLRRRGPAQAARAGSGGGSGAQIVMSANKEAVLSEKELRAGFNQRVLVGYSEVIRSGDFADVPAFVRAVQAEWDRQWRRVYTADWAGACVGRLAKGARARRAALRHWRRASVAVRCKRGG